MALSIKHKFQSGRADGSDTGRVRPSNWNADHDITVGANALVGRGATAGAAEEIPCTAFARTLLDDDDPATARETLGAQASISITMLDAAADGATNDLSVFQSAYDTAISLGVAAVIVPPGTYRVDGDVDGLDLESARFVFETGANIIGHNNLAGFKAGSLKYEAYDPTITRTTIFDGTTPNQTNHVPWIEKYSDKLWAVYQGPDPGPDTTIKLSTSDDEGATWATRVEPFIDSDYSTNPVTPSGQDQTEGRIVRVKDELWAFYCHRTTNESLYWARLTSADGKWTNYRFLIDSSDSSIVWDDTNLDGAAPSGFALRLTVDGKLMSLIPQDAKVLSNGRVALVCVALTNWQVDHRVIVFTCALDGTDWQVGGHVPDGGSLAEGEEFEPVLAEAVDGTYTIIARRHGISGAGQKPRGARQLVSTSPDLKGWSSWRLTEDDVHQNRVSIGRASLKHWLGIGTIHSTQRFGMGLKVSGDGAVFTTTTRLDDADPTLRAAHYSDLCRGDGVVYAIWSEALTGRDPQDIKFARAEQRLRDDRLYVFASEKNAIEISQSTGTLTTAEVSEFSGDNLVVKPRGMGVLETRGEVYAVTLRWRVTVAPGSIPYRIATVGSWFGNVALILRSSGELQVNGRTVRTVNDPTDWQETEVLVDTRQSVAMIEGVRAGFSGGARFYLGDAFNQPAGEIDATGNQAGDIEYYIPALRLREIDRLPAIVPATPVSQPVPNYLLNPGFEIDQDLQGGDYSTTGTTLDGWVLSDIGGATLTVKQATFSIAAAQARNQGWKFGLRVNCTVAGTTPTKLHHEWDGVGFMVGRDVVFAFDAVSGGDPYVVDVVWIQDFGSGGSSQIAATVDRITVGIHKRHVVRFRVPLLPSGSTTGTADTARLEIQLPTDDAAIAFTITRADFYPGHIERPWIEPLVDVEWYRLQRLYRVIRAEDDSFQPLMISGRAHSTTEVRIPIIFSPPMRKAPSFSKSGTINILPGGAADTVTIARAGPSGADVVATKSTAPFTVGDCHALGAGNDLTARLTFNARRA